MIFPIRCMTCGKVIGDFWNAYNEEIKKEKAPEETIDINAKKIEKTHRGKILDKFGMDRYCCRRHFLTHVDLMETI